MMKLKKLSLVLVLTTLLLVSCGQVNEQGKPSSAYETVTVKINDTININYAPILFAEKLGYFAEYGIELEKVKFTHVADAIPLLGTGHLDVYAGSVTAGFLHVLGQEPGIKVVADRGLVAPGQCTFLAFLIRKDLVESGQVQGPADLEGLEINATASNPTGYLLSEYLEGSGVSIDDVILTNLPEATYIDAFANKTLDGIITPEIKVTRTLQAGDSVILATMEDVVGSYQSSVLTFGKSLIEDNPDLGVRFMAAYLKGLEVFNQGKTEENLQVLHEALGEDVDLLRDACWVYIHPQGMIDFQNVVPFMNWSVENGYLDAPITEEQYWDPSFLEAALALISQ